MLYINRLRCNHEKRPLGVTGTPAFSWEVSSDLNQTRQTAFQMIIQTNQEIIFDSGKVQSKQTVEYRPPDFIAMPFIEYSWTVKVWDNHGNEAEATSHFEGALEQWQAQWIEPANGGIKYEKPISVAKAAIFKTKPKQTPEERLMPVTLLRKEFSVKPGLKKARAYATAHGTYILELNNQRVDQRLLAPEYSAYEKYLCYQTYDITAFLGAGENACGIMLADGWWGGRIGMGGECGQYGMTRAVLIQIELFYQDGSRETVISDDRFRYSDEGLIRYSDIFIGEKQDNNYLERMNGYSAPGFQANGWEKVIVKPYGYKELKPQIGGAVRPFKELKPVVLHTPNGEDILDFGQNFAGYVRFCVAAEAGTVITLEHGEVLSRQGNFINNILGVNKDQKDCFVCCGKEKECFEPRFTFHGFRYVRVSGIGQLHAEDYTGIAITTEMDNLAEFACSNPLLNKLYSNARWSQYSNMISIPTDCPQREKAGWTGDIQIFAPTACYHQDMDAFLRRWMESVRAEQYDDGQIPAIVPYTKSYKAIMNWQYSADSSCGWSDVCIIVPYVLYQMYHDKDVLAEYYPIMKKWLTYVQNQAENQVSEQFQKKKHKTAQEIENQKYLWNTGFHFGDWLVPSKQEQFMGGAFSRKKTELIFAAMYYAYDTQLMYEISSILGYQKEAEYYSDLNKKIRKALMETYISEDGRIEQDSEGVYVCALAFGLVPETKIPAAAARLEQLIRENGYRLDTGFLATPLLLDVLVANGRKELAYKLLYQDQYPSWLYEINRGATTIWECWDGIKPNGKVGNMSYNHYAFGCVSDFMNRMIVGIRKEAAGYEKILIKPEPDETLTWAKGSYRCIYGTIVCSWKKTKGKFELHIEIPCGAFAKVVLPDGEEHEVESGTYEFICI